MKHLFKTLTFSFLSAKLMLELAPFFSFGGDNKTYLLFVTLLTLLYLYKKNILEMLSLPIYGPGFLFISTLLTFAVINIFAVLFSRFSINRVEFENLLLFGFVIPSLRLEKVFSGLLAALVISILNNYFDWLSRKK